MAKNKIASTDDVDDDDERRGKSRRPKDTTIRQQRSVGWQPVITASNVLPAFYVIGIVFVQVGLVLLYFDSVVYELSIDYTDCTALHSRHNNVTCAKLLELNVSAQCRCQLPLSLERDMEGDVYMYYGLTNYYQNHRLYVRSRDDEQLMGHLDQRPTADCKPFQQYDASSPQRKEVRMRDVAPCGAIANSLFNDTLQLLVGDHEDDKLDANGQQKSTKNRTRAVHMKRVGIAWPERHRWNFQNPPGDLRIAILKRRYAKPIAWSKALYELDPDHDERDDRYTNNGFRNEELIVWMEVAAMTTFRKLHRRLDRSKRNQQLGLQRGRYRLQVDYKYPVSSFDGRKLMILSNTSFMGARNPFMGTLYVTAGSLSVLFGMCVLFVHIMWSKKIILNAFDGNRLLNLRATSYS